MFLILCNTTLNTPMDHVAWSERILWYRSCVSPFDWWGNRLHEVKWLCPRIQSWGVAARALGIQALFSRAFPLFFTRLPYLEHQHALLWVLKWEHRLPTHTPLGSYFCCTLSDGWRRGFPSSDWLSQSSSAGEWRVGRQLKREGIIYMLLVESRCCMATQHCKTIRLQLNILKNNLKKFFFFFFR